MNHKQYILTKYALCDTLDRLSKARCTDDYCLKDNHPIIGHLQIKVKHLKEKIKEYEYKQISNSLYS